MSRVSGRRTHTFEADSFFFLHVINCFERPSLDDEDADRTAQAADGEVVVDICCYKDPAMISCMYIDALKVWGLLVSTNIDRIKDAVKCGIFCCVILHTSLSSLSYFYVVWKGLNK